MNLVIRDYVVHAHTNNQVTASGTQHKTLLKSGEKTIPEEKISIYVYRSLHGLFIFRYFMSG